MPAPRIIFINRFYWPESPATAQLLTDLAEALAHTPIRVTILTSGACDLRPTERRNGVEIFRLSRRKVSRASLVRRAVDCYRFSAAARRWIHANVDKSDVIVCLTDPPMIGTMLRPTISKKGARLIHWVQDIFPEVARAVLPIPLLAGLQKSRNRSWQEATRCVVPGEDMARVVAAGNVAPEKIVVIPNWSPAGLQPQSAEGWRARHNLEEKFVVMYSGNLGRVHDFSMIVPLAKRLERHSEVVLVFIGQGPRLQRLRTETSAAHSSNVHFLPAVAREQLAETLSGGDLHVVTIRAGCENLVFPSKLYGIAAVGRPALVIGPANCEPARLVVRNGWGYAAAPTAVEKIADDITGLLKNANLRRSLNLNALAFAQQHGFQKAVAAWQILLRSSGAIPDSLSTSAEASVL